MGNPKLRSPTEFLELLQDKDIAQLWTRWSLPTGVAPRRDAIEFCAAVERLSMTTLVQEVLAITSDTVTMLRDVIAFLATHLTTLRTTGGVLVLDEVFGLLPQEIDAVLKWSDRSMRKHSLSTWERLLQEFEKEVAPFLNKMVYAADVSFRVRWEQMDLIEGYQRDPLQAYLYSRTGQNPPHKKVQIATWNADAVSCCGNYAVQISRLIEKLTSLTDEQIPAEAISLAAALRTTLQKLRAAANPRAKCGHADEHIPSHSGYGVAANDRERWRRFQEEVLFLAEVEESCGFADVLRLDLFRKRPQLYEVWCLALLLNFFRQSGYRVNLESISTNELGRVVWMLNYSRSQKPIAKIETPSSDQQYWLFYQLFRKGTARDEMPDIALLPTPNPKDSPIWIMDPKHSDRGSYSVSDYREVALRYYAVFQPQRTYILEYYPRPDICKQAAIGFADGVELLLGVSPSGSGTKALAERLRQIHPLYPVTLAIVDVSSSFSGALDRVRADLLALLGNNVVLSEETIVFSESARFVPTSSVIDVTPIDGIGEGGTLFRPVLHLIAELDAKGIMPTAIRVYTDGQFSDMTLGEARELLSFHAELIFC